MSTDGITDATGGGAGAEPSSTLPKVLFLCTGNSCRSQMAEGWARALRAGELEAYSAGIAPHTLDPRAVQVMAEAGVDISGQYSKQLDELRDIAFNCVITVCNKANESCPVFPGGTTRLHEGFDDPPSLVRGLINEEEVLAVYRRVRDEIRDFVENLPATLIRLSETAPPE